VASHPSKGQADGLSREKEIEKKDLLKSPLIEKAPLNDSKVDVVRKTDLSKRVLIGRRVETPGNPSVVLVAPKIGVSVLADSKSLSTKAQAVTGLSKKVSTAKETIVQAAAKDAVFRSQAAVLMAKVGLLKRDLTARMRTKRHAPREKVTSREKSDLTQESSNANLL
jgi:hypothetical protein